MCDIVLCVRGLACSVIGLALELLKRIRKSLIVEMDIMMIVVVNM